MLEVIDIFHNYNEKKLLDGISFEVRENEVLSLLGPSGSGKSTILKIIAGLETPISGTVRYNGKDILSEPVYKRNFGFVFQDYALFPHMNVFENIAFGLTMKGIKGSELDRKVNAALHQVGMSRFGDRKVTELSGGEQQRVALARSLVVEPALLMLDEPLGALDYSLRQTLIGELREILGKNGIPAIYVTHDQNEALSLSDRIAILHNGIIEQCCSPEELFTHPCNEWCANFLGFHNFIDGFFEDEETLVIRNFEKKLTLLIPNGRNQYGNNIRILLKEGKINGNNPYLKFDAIVQQCTYRGSYYDVRLEIANGLSVTVKSDVKRELFKKVVLSYDKNSIIFYTGNNPV